MVPMVPEPTLLMNDAPGHEPEYEADASSLISGAIADPRPPFVDDFIASFRKLLSQPVLPSTPLLPKTRVAHNDNDEDWVPKRSARAHCQEQI